MRPDLAARYADERLPRYTSYPTAPQFTQAVGPETCASWLGATPDQTQRVIDRIMAEYGLRCETIVSDTTVIGVKGVASVIDEDRISELPGVDRIIRITEKFKDASRAFHPDDSVVMVGGRVPVGGGNLTMFGGPCAIESEQQALESATFRFESRGEPLTVSLKEVKQALEELHSQGMLRKLAAYKGPLVPRGEADIVNPRFTYMLLFIVVLVVEIGRRRMDAREKRDGRALLWIVGVFLWAGLVMTAATWITVQLHWKPVNIIGLFTLTFMDVAASFWSFEGATWLASTGWTKPNSRRLRVRASNSLELILRGFVGSGCRSSMGIWTICRSAWVVTIGPPRGGGREKRTSALQGAASSFGWLLRNYTQQGEPASLRSGDQRRLQSRHHTRSLTDPTPHAIRLDR